MPRKPSMAYQHFGATFADLARIASSATPVPNMELPAKSGEFLRDAISWAGVPDWKVHEWGQAQLAADSRDWRPSARALIDMFMWSVAIRLIHNEYARSLTAGRAAARARTENRNRNKTDFLGALQRYEQQKRVSLSPRTPPQSRKNAAGAIGYHHDTLLRLLKKRSKTTAR